MIVVIKGGWVGDSRVIKGGWVGDSRVIKGGWVIVELSRVGG